MASFETPLSHEETARVLRRAGYSDKFIRELLSELPDPIDPRRDRPIFERHGVNEERLADAMGGSP